MIILKCQRQVSAVAGQVAQVVKQHGVVRLQLPGFGINAFGRIILLQAGQHVPQIHVGRDRGRIMVDDLTVNITGLVKTFLPNQERRIIDQDRLVTRPQAPGLVQGGFGSRILLETGIGQAEVVPGIVMIRLELDNALEKVFRRHRFTTVEQDLAQIIVGDPGSVVFFQRIAPQRLGIVKRQAPVPSRGNKPEQQQGTNQPDSTGTVRAPNRADAVTLQHESDRNDNHGNHRRHRQVLKMIGDEGIPHWIHIDEPERRQKHPRKNQCPGQGAAPPAAAAAEKDNQYRHRRDRRENRRHRQRISGPARIYENQRVRQQDLAGIEPHRPPGDSAAIHHRQVELGAGSADNMPFHPHRHPGHPETNEKKGQQQHGLAPQFFRMPPPHQDKHDGRHRTSHRLAKQACNKQSQRQGVQPPAPAPLGTGGKSPVDQEAGEIEDRTKHILSFGNPRDRLDGHWMYRENGRYQPRPGH